MEQECDSDTNCNWCSWYSHQRIDIGTRGVEIRGQVENIQTTALSTNDNIDHK